MFYKFWRSKEQRVKSNRAFPPCPWAWEIRFFTFDLIKCIFMQLQILNANVRTETFLCICSIEIIQIEMLSLIQMLFCMLKNENSHFSMCKFVYKVEHIMKNEVFLLHKSHPQLIVHISSLHILILKWRCVPENGFQRLNVYIKLHESGTFSFLNCMWKPGYSSFFVSSAIVYCLDNCHLRSFPFKF